MATTSLAVIIDLIKERARAKDAAKVEGAFKQLDTVLILPDKRDLGLLRMAGINSNTVGEVLDQIVVVITAARKVEAENAAMDSAIATLQKTLG